jgi:hypothetical protein
MSTLPFPTDLGTPETYRRITSALSRFQNNPGPLAHFQVIFRIDEDRLLERGFADFVIADPGQQFVAAVGLDDLEAEVFHDPTPSLEDEMSRFILGVVLGCFLGIVGAALAASVSGKGWRVGP